MTGVAENECEGNIQESELFYILIKIPSGSDIHKPCCWQRGVPLFSRLFSQFSEVRNLPAPDPEATPLDADYENNQVQAAYGAGLIGALRRPEAFRNPSAPSRWLSPSGFLLPLLLLQMFTWYSAGQWSQFSVKGPAEPIVVSLGADATLPCQLSPEQSAADMHIRWYRAQLSPAVLVFQDGQEHSEEQMLEYRGRTQLVTDSIDTGSVTLLIQNVRASDDGQYWCHFRDGDILQEATVELNVEGLGTIPRVHMTGPEDGGIRVLCSSGGWFPKPTVQWRDSAGGKLPSPAASQTQDGDGLFQVEASLVVKDSSLGNVTCSIQNPLSGQELASAIFLPEPFFPKVSPWKAALAWTVPVLSLLIAGISYIGWRERQAKEREIKKSEREAKEREEMKKGKEAAFKSKESLENELKQRKKLYLEDWKKALLYPDWRKEKFQPAKVTIHNERLSENNSGTEGKENHGEESQNLITVEQRDFTSGRYFWEVDIKDADEWTLGIFEENTVKNAPSSEPSRKKFRVLEKKRGAYRALGYCLQEIFIDESLRIEKDPQKIVIFLDYGDSDVSFYDIVSGDHIFSFTKSSFSGSLYPYFSRKPVELSVRAQPAD
ncbi:butyrophilin-like protein 1 [Lepus europaeus]|uniref:butyrophilin-like protein 1 n=1 Tax=Lepus europaeus TaxID=9983 RepID=UPI002B464DEA|nr:butyrophilin-like protein 1 [Lepus europaeus]